MILVHLDMGMGDFDLRVLQVVPYLIADGGKKWY